jgi:hypothetical protein
VEVACASPHWPTAARPAVVPGGVELQVPADAGPELLLALGALAQRVAALALAEGVPVEPVPFDASRGVLRIRALG